MSLFVDTSVWSLAFRRDSVGEEPEVRRLREALGSSEPIYTAGIVLQELLQGFSGPKAKARILDRFAEVAAITPTRGDYINAAELRNQCRRRGVQIGTIDALLAQICIQHSLVLLSTDRDFVELAKLSTLSLWNQS